MGRTERPPEEEDSDEWRWLFYVQHECKDTYRYQHAGWSYFDAGLQGISHLVLPKPFQWFTASIGIHHLSVRIPNYRLQRSLD